jgi:hypothetical protein
MGKPQTLMVGDTVGFDAERSGGRTFRIGTVAKIDDGHAWIKLNETEDFQRMWRRPIEDLDDLQLYLVSRGDGGGHFLLTTDQRAAEHLTASIDKAKLHKISPQTAREIDVNIIFIGYKAKVVIDRI